MKYTKIELSENHIKELTGNLGFTIFEGEDIKILINRVPVFEDKIE